MSSVLCGNGWGDGKKVATVDIDSGVLSIHFALTFDSAISWQGCQASILGGYRPAARRWHNFTIVFFPACGFRFG